MMILFSLTILYFTFTSITFLFVSLNAASLFFLLLLFLFLRRSVQTILKNITIITYKTDIPLVGEL